MANRRSGSSVLDLLQITALARYITRMFIVRLVIILVGGALLAISADLMETGKDIINSAPDRPWLAVLRYSALRLPSFISAVLPMATLLAGLLTVGALQRHSELVAILNTGLSPTGLIRLLLAAGLLLVGAQFLVDDWLAPRSVDELFAWGVGDFKKRLWRPETENGLWLYSGGDVIRLQPIEGDRDHLANVTIFRRDADGMLLERIDAPRAKRTETGLVLEDAIRRQALDGSTTSVAELTWPGVIDFSTIELLSREPRDLRLSQLATVVDHAGFGQRPPDIYRTWYHARLAAAVQPLFMVLLSISLIPSYSRTGSFGRLLLSGVSIGFAAFILGGVTTAMGEAGLLPPLLAAWAPALVLLALIGRFLLQHEVLGRARPGGRAPA
jgi:lipopolysaccharide export system permease protein